MRVVAHYFRAELVGLGIKESVEAIKASCKWPTIEWTSGTRFCEWGDVPFAHHVIAVTVRAQNFTEGACFFGDLSSVAGVTTVEVGEAADTN